MQDFLISSSILSADFANLGRDVKQAIDAGADLIHFDVMDNHYVPNLTVGPMVLKSLRKYGISAPIDVHLMVNPTEDHLLFNFIEAGANYISFHPETTKSVENSLRFIKDNQCKAGLVFSPDKPVNFLEYVEKLDFIVLMSVFPGFAGQPFLFSSFQRIRQAREVIRSSGKDIRLEVDGGIKIENITEIAQAGANIFVIGSEIFGRSNYRSIIEILRHRLFLVDQLD